MIGREKHRAAPARQIAVDVLNDVRGGHFAEHALSERLSSGKKLKPEDRALATELVYGVLRWKRRLDAIIRRCSHVSLHRIKPQARDILRIALYQVFLLNRIPDHAAVDDAVSEARHRLGNKTASFINAVLRHASRDRSVVDPSPDDNAASLADYYSHPLWLVKRWFEKLGVSETRRVLALNNTRPAVVVRVNTLKSSVEELKKLWESHGLQNVSVGPLPDSLSIPSAGGPVDALPGYQEGLFIVQDYASQMIAPLLAPTAGDRILDACAAPGGKTSHLAALAGNEVSITAVDSDPDRLEDMRKNLARLGAKNVDLKRGDVSDPAFVKDLGLFNRILMDAPCSNLGVLRHNPEIKYRIGASESARWAEYQLKLLDSVSSALVPRGLLVYSVCSISDEETTGVVSRFLQHHPQFSVTRPEASESTQPSFINENGLLNTFPPHDEWPMDGFFAARFRRDSI
ncbi:MAG: 16S rRNA (cytosine(967)-C(5))-methyltransferase RsmB [Thermodesulfobacteriota bacterium]